MAIPSDGSYGIPEGIMYSFPVRVDPSTKDWSIVQGLQIDEFSRGKMTVTLKELEEEKTEALAACEHWLATGRNEYVEEKFVDLVKNKL